MFLPGHVANFHFDTQHLEQSQVFLVLWLVDFLLYRIYKCHQVATISYDKIQTCPVCPNKRHTLPIEESVLFDDFILFCRFGKKSVLHQLYLIAFVS